MKLKIAFPDGADREVETGGISEYRGVLIFTHAHNSATIMSETYRASEAHTGCGIPTTFANTEAEALSLAKAQVDKRGPSAFEDQLAKFAKINAVNGSMILDEEKRP